MAEEKKTVPTPEEHGPEPPAPGAPEAPPAPEPGAQGVIPGMEGPPLPENKVINLSSVRAGAGQEQTGPAPEGGQEWEKPQEQPEQKPRRGRRPKNKEAPTQGNGPKRKGRPPKAEKQATPGGGGAGKAAKAPKQTKSAGKSTPAKEEAPPPPSPAPEQPPQPKDASRAEKEEIVYLDLDQLHPFQNHPFGVRDDMEMKGLVSSVQAGGVHQPALVRPREGGGMPLEVNFQQSLFGKTSWELCYQETGWILEPSCNLSQTPKFQCLLLDAGPTPEWCEAEAVTCAGVCWTPSIGQTPGLPGVSGCSSWLILEADVPERSCLSPAACSRYLRLAETLGCPPPEAIEYLLLKQGGRYQSSTPFKATVCGARPRRGTSGTSWGASENQLTLFPLCLPGG